MRGLVRLLLVALILISGLAGSKSSAEVLKVRPTMSGIVRQDGKDAVFVKLDMPATKEGRTIVVESAFLVMQSNGLPADESSYYSAFRIVSPWSEERVVAGLDSLNVDPAPVAEWALEPQDVERLGRIVRLDISDVVLGWLENPESNNGLLFMSPHAGRDELEPGVSNIDLIVRYGYVQRP